MVSMGNLELESLLELAAPAVEASSIGEEALSGIGLCPSERDYMDEPSEKAMGWRYECRHHSESDL